MCRCLEVRCVQVYLVSKCRVCNALVSVYGSQALVLVKCCNSKSQVLNKSFLFSLLFDNLVSELLLTQQYVYIYVYMYVCMYLYIFSINFFIFFWLVLIKKRRLVLHINFWSTSYYCIFPIKF